MKKIFFATSLIILFTLTFLIIVLSTLGYETDKFNRIISEKINEKNYNILLKLEKIRFKFDIKNLSLFLQTSNPDLEYRNLDIPINNIKVYLNPLFLIKSEVKINKINIRSEELNINQLKNIIIKTKPSNLNSFINNKVKNGKLTTDVEFYFNDNQEIEDFIAKGEVKEMDAIITNDLYLKDTEFNFFADSSDVLIKNIKSKTDAFLIKDGNLQIQKDEEINIKSDFTTNIKINKENISKYLSFSKNFEFINKETIFNANLNHFLDVTFDKTFKVTNYIYTNKGKINELSIKFDKSIKNLFLENKVDNLYFKDSDFNTRFSSDKKNNINSTGTYSIDKKNYKNYDFKNNFSNKVLNINLNFDFIQKLNFDFINYKKDDNEIANIFLDIDINKNFINIKDLQYKENKSRILIEKLKIDKKNRNIISLKKIKVKTFDKNNLKNDFTLNFGKAINISGTKYDANNLNKFLSQKSKNNILKKINKSIDIDLKNIDTPLSKKLQNFKLIGVIEKGKFVKISSKGDFGNNKYLDISMKKDKKYNKKYLEIYSDLPQPLLSEYSFFKGLSDGVLTFSSIIENNTSSSKLIIEDFKLINAPGVVKLLSLADFGGLADLAEGEGLSFQKMEINMSNDKGFLKLKELYAVGPSISVLMEGYKDPTGLTSLRGTLVPAKNLNKLLSKIPVIGKIIIPKEIGEGLFGVSFKMKGMPGKVKTTINPIKTLTPRFITKALEKSKKSK